MQTVTGYPTDLTSVAPTFTVTHNGVARKAESVSVDRELPSNLPGQVAGGTGITAATGTVEWADGALSVSKRVHPWGAQSFPPKPYDTITIASGYGGVEARLLTGVTRAGSGQLSDRFVSSEVIDGINRLNTTVSIEPLLATMPPLASGGDYRYIGITPTYFTDRALRAAGFFATPAQESGCVFSAPLMGSSWPERGALTASSAADVLGSPSWVETPSGQGAYSLNASYTGAFTPTYDGKLTQTLQMSMVLDPSSTVGGTGGGSLTAWWDTDHVRLAVSTSGAVIAQLKSGSTVTEACRLTIGTAKGFTLRVTPAGGWTIRANDGREATGTLPITALMSGAVMSSVQVLAGHQAKYPMNGVQVCFTAVYAAVNHVQNAFLTPAAYRFSLEASPALESRNVLDLLREQAGAECAAMGLDEYGAFRWINRDRLTPEGPVTETITPASKMEDLEWEHNTGSVRSEVIITYQVPAVSLSRWVNLLAYQGSGESMEPGQKNVEFISPPTDTDWVLLDTTPERVGDAGTTGPFNRGWSSFYAGTVTDGGTLDRLASATELTVTLEKLGLSSLKLTTTVGSLPSGTTLELRMPEVVSGIWPQWSEDNLIMLRASAVTKWTALTVTGVNRGPTGAPVLTHETGWWVHANDVQRLADWLSAQVSVARPVIRSLQVIPDDRRQLADIVQVEFDAVSLRCLVTGVSNQTSTTGKGQSLSLRVISALSGTTNAVMDTAYATKTNTQFDTAWSLETNNTLDSDPLRKA